MLFREDLLALLAQLGIRHSLHEHEAVMTVAEARAVRRGLEGVLCKCLLFADTGGSLWLLTAHADIRVDMKELARQLGCGRLSFAPPETLFETLGCKPGSSSILGLVNDTGRRVTAVIQGSLLAVGLILHFHPLVNTASVGIGTQDLMRFLDHIHHPPVIVDGIEKSSS